MILSASLKDPDRTKTNFLRSSLEHLNVLELSSVLAGPLVGSFLAELGAKVIKVENKTTGGDVTRQWKNAAEDGTDEYSAYYAAANFGKQSVLLDFNTPADLEEVHRLIACSDVVLSNFQKRVGVKYRLDPHSVFQNFPGIIFVQLDAYDYDDTRPGFDMVMQAETGYLSMTGSGDGQPVKIPVAMMDVLAAHQMKEGLLLALLKKAKTGNGSLVFVSLYRSALSGLVNQASNYLNNGLVAKPMGSLHPNIAPYGEILTFKDGKRILLAVGSDAQFDKLADLLKFDKYQRNKYIKNKDRILQRSALFKDIQSKAVNFTRDEFCKMMDAVNIPYGLIKDLSEVFSDPLAQEMVVTNDQGYRLVSQLGFRTASEFEKQAAGIPECNFFD